MWITGPARFKALVCEQTLSMAKSARRNKAEGALDKLAGRVLEAVSKLTGNRSARAKGKAARGRGAGRSGKGRLRQKRK